MSEGSYFQLDSPVRRRETAAEVKPMPNLIVLEKRWLHSLMVWLHKPVAWPPWLVAAGLLLVSGLVFWLWRAALGPAGTGPALAAGLGLLAAGLLDWAVLAWLPRSRRSFGPVVPQLLVLLGPRLAGAVGAALAARWWGPVPGLWLFGAVQLLGTLSYVWGLAIEPLRLSLTRLEVDVDEWPASAPALRLLHISDIHLERLGRREERLLALAEAARPDLIVLTGDYLNLSNNRDPVAIDQVRSLLTRLHAPLGVFAVLGSPPADVRDVAPFHFENSHIQLLRRDVVELDLGEGRSLAFLGLDCTHDLDYDGEVLRRLVKLAPPQTPRVMLYHSPELMPVAQHLGLRLYLCGHTHGGQLRLPLYGAVVTSSSTGKRYEMGRYDENGTTQYVSRGIGLEGLSVPRMRLLCPPEMTLVTLRGKQGG